MDFLLDSKGSKYVDNYTINNIGVPSLVLQERAAYSVAMGICYRFEKSKNITAVCGIGNNGADGLCTIKILKTLGYYNLSVYILGDLIKCSEEFNVQLNIINNLGIKVIYINDNLSKDKQQNIFNEYDVIIDGIFGIGLTREIEGYYKTIINMINLTHAYKIAIDIPSGVDATDAHILGVAIKANETYTFGKNKCGLILYEGADYTGDIHTINIGFADKAYDFVDKTYYLEKEDIHKIFLPRKANTNKGSYGKLLIFAGNEDMCGAALLATKAAFTLGCGLIKIITTNNNKQVINNMLPEAIVSVIPDDETEMKNMILEAISWSTVVLAGPGMGCSKRTSKILEICLLSKKPLVIDADGINVLSMNYLKKDLLHENVIITPHLFELSKFINKSIDEIKQRMIATAKETASRYKINLVMKDTKTVITNSFGETYINISGNSGMAKAGSGDVLAGITAGLIAIGHKVQEASYMAPYIHGLAGDIAKDKKGIYSMMPSDIILALTDLYNI